MHNKQSTFTPAWYLEANNNARVYTSVVLKVWENQMETLDRLIQGMTWQVEANSSDWEWNQKLKMCRSPWRG